jgi:hypothetical protein
MMPRMHDLDDLVGLIEIAKRLDQKSSAVVRNWIDRYSDFPKPLMRASNTPIYSMRQVLYWHANKWPKRPS